MAGEAGTRIPEQSPGTFHCGTEYSGWMRGVHPATPGDQVLVDLCFDAGKYGECFLTLKNITVINCGDFFLYDLPETPGCWLRYCGSFV